MSGIARQCAPQLLFRVGKPPLVHKNFTRPEQSRHRRRRTVVGQLVVVLEGGLQMRLGSGRLRGHNQRPGILGVPGERLAGQSLRLPELATGDLPPSFGDELFRRRRGEFPVEQQKSRSEKHGPAGTKPDRRAKLSQGVLPARNVA